MKKDIAFTKEQNNIWHQLFDNQIQNVERFACKEFLQGFQILNLSNKKVPLLNSINKKITPITSWQATRTKIRYSGALPWYQHFARHEFIVTNYLRSWDEFEFTPEPDMFHDIFGHLPFLTLPEYVELFELFSSAYLRANDIEREKIGKLAWFSYEFGLIEAKSKLKIFGAGIISSIGETNQIVTGKTKFEKFTIGNVLKHQKAIANFNETLFVFDSLTSLKQELKKFLAPIAKRNIVVDINGTIMDTEMDLRKY